MSSAIRQIINIADNDLTIIEHQGERVVTLGMIDQVHQRPEGTAGRNLRTNKDRFVEGKHLYKICSDEFRRSNPGVISNKSHEDVILLTQRGYLLLVKSFTDDLSWQVQDMLVDSYFAIQRQATPSGSTRIANHRLCLQLSKELYRARDPELRKLIHRQLVDVSNALGLPVPELDNLGHAAPQVLDVVEPFWQALAFLDGKGVDYNHATASSLLAVNLPELARLLIDHGHPLRFDNDLRQGLWMSKAPRCLHKNRTIHSRITGKAIRCWVFERSSV